MEILLEYATRIGVETIYRALTEQTGVASWFTTDTVVEPVVGSVAEFRFDGGKRRIRVEITELEPDRKICWKLLEHSWDWECMDSMITWELTPVEWGTLVHFSHGGWETNEGAFPSVAYKWATFLTSLKTYVETGKGSPAY
jgi:uncharacterized protein YndB with AHSA1/START domain